MAMQIERVAITTTPQCPHFIGSWQIAPLTLCDELIGFFETHPENQAQGKTAGGLNTDAKQSLDLTIRPRELDRDDHEPVRNYLDALYACYQDYTAQWPFLQGMMPRAEVSSFNIQRYAPGGHFLKVHSERTTLASSHRVLAWMTYLDDVADGGATHFVHYGLKVQPARGRTLIWPAEWTHAHQAEVLKSGAKHIITGWMHFPPHATGTGSAP